MGWTEPGWASPSCQPPLLPHQAACRVAPLHSLPLLVAPPLLLLLLLLAPPTAAGAPPHPAAGEALVYGESLASVGGMARVRPLMGVCPQVGGWEGG